MQNAYKITQIYNAPTFSIDSSFARYVDGISAKTLMSGNVPIMALPDENYSKSCNVNVLECASMSGEYASLFEEICGERIKEYGYDIPMTALTKRTLCLDFLLKTYVCYVEICKDNMRTKFYATRNPELLRFLQNIDVNDTAYGAFAMNYGKKDLNTAKTFARVDMICSPLSEKQLIEGTIPFVRLEKKKATMSLIEPKKATDLKVTKLRITPVYFNMGTANMLWNRLQTEILELVYVKDNSVLRSVTSTLNLAYITKACAGDRSHAVTMQNYANCNSLSRGYMTLPELLLPNTDETGCRAVSIRFFDIKKVDPATFENPFAKIDIESVPAQFNRYLELYRNDKATLEHIKYAIELDFGELSRPNVTDVQRDAMWKKICAMSAEAIITDLNNWLSFCISIDKTQTLRGIHLFMLRYPMIFSRYTGIRFESDILTDYTTNI